MKKSANATLQAMMAQSREKANKEFREERYESAVQMYTHIVAGCSAEQVKKAEQVKRSQHVVLSNRSAAYEKLQEYGSAAQDALEVICMMPAWVKGYTRLGNARLGNCDAAGALEAVRLGNAALTQQEDLIHLRRIEDAARALPQVEHVDPEALSCWNDVEFKSAVFIVDGSGKGDFTSLSDALTSIPKPASIIILSGVYSLNWPLSLIGLPLQVQIIGILPAQGRSRVKIESAAASPILVLCDGARSEVTLQGLDLVSTASSGSEVAHCALASNSATINMNDCTMRATGACCVVSRNGRMFLSGSKTFGPGGGALAAENSFFSAEDCVFSRSRGSGVEIREGASCCFKRCEISSNNAGAITSYQDGIKATFEDCKVMSSGRLQGRSAVMVGCGTLTMRGCTVQENPCDGIMVQDDDGTAHLDISNSMCNNNGGCRAVLYITIRVSACVSDCRIQENQMIGFACHPNGQGNRPFREVRLVRNIIVANNVGIIGSGISKKRLRQLVHLEGNHCHSLASFHTCTDMHNMVKAEFANLQKTPVKGSAASSRKDPNKLSKQREWTSLLSYLCALSLASSSTILQTTQSS